MTFFDNMRASSRCPLNVGAPKEYILALIYFYVNDFVSRRFFLLQMTRECSRQEVIALKV